MKKLLLVDCGNLVYRNVYTAVNVSEEDNWNFNLWKSLFLNSLFQTIVKHSPDRVIIAQDEKNNWRKDLYDKYKFDRAAKTAKSNINFDRFFPIMEDYLQQIKETFTNIIFLKLPRTEADDVISTICLNSSDTENIIVSTDSDFNQLINTNTKQYNPIKDEFVSCINSKRALQLKVIIGDKSDCISSIKERVGPKTASKLLDEGLQDLLESDDKIKELYERNEKLIDLSLIPKEYKEKILTEYENYPVKELQLSKVFNFLIKNRLQKIIDELNSYEDIIKKLK